VIYKKIDSTLRGNIGPEVEAILETCGYSFAILAPAFPKMGRTLVEGYLRPWLLELGAPHLPTLLREQGVQGVAHISRHLIRKARKDRQTLTDELRRLTGAGARFIVMDAVTDADLALIAQTSLTLEPPPLLVGSAGLAAQAAAVMAEESPPVLLHPPEAKAEEREEEDSGPVLLFIGSNHPKTDAQLERLKTDELAEVVPLDAWTVEKTCAATGAVCHCVIPIKWDEQEERHLRQLRPVLEEAAVRGLVLSGGDTAARVCSALETHAILLKGEVATGMPWGRLIGGRAHGIAVCTKAGGFGEEDALTNAVRFLARI
jgi:uncharacterized protein YgbK (DUF1537 family)